MSGSAVRDALIAFLADPKAFMANNIVLPPMSPSNAMIKGTGSGIFQFSWAKSDKVGTKGTAQCAIYRVGNTDAYNTGDPRFMAYYCHYSTDSTYDLVVSDAMNLMLTPAMNGCSFGVGSPGSNGARRVAHANVSRTESSAQGITAQGVTQAQNIGTIIPNATIIGPDDYVAPDVFGTTVGVRNGSQWSFFMQKWKRPTSSTYILDSIVDIV